VAIAGAARVDLPSEGDPGRTILEEPMHAIRPRSVNGNCRDTSNVVDLKTKLLTISRPIQPRLDIRLNRHWRSHDSRLDGHGYVLAVQARAHQQTTRYGDVLKFFHGAASLKAFGSDDPFPPRLRGHRLAGDLVLTHICHDLH
jgi:hypothetical protein